jgi:glycerophosphoryl diester phosphodiesterase
VTSIETDVHLTADGIPVLYHDPLVSSRICRRLPGANLGPVSDIPLSRLTLAELRRYRADGNPDPGRFPSQDTAVTPLAGQFAAALGIDPFTPPTVAELFAFLRSYAGEPGRLAGKTDQQRWRASRAGIDLEIKRVPGHPETVGDRFDGLQPARLEHELIDIIRRAGMVERTTVRSFDHRCVRLLREIEPRLTGAVLITHTAPVDPVALVRQANALLYCPDIDFLDELQVKQCQAAGIRVLPWTVNDPADAARLLRWGVDGFTTDFPDRFAAWLDWEPPATRDPAA